MSCLSLTVLFSQISYYYCQFFLTSYEEDICNVIVIHNINYLSKISLLIKNDDFLSANISQIIILENQQINLRLRRSNVLIELGNNFNLNKKIQNLKAFYTRAYELNEVDKYKKLNLRFENQVIAVKKTNL